MSIVGREIDSRAAIIRFEARNKHRGDREIDFVVVVVKQHFYPVLNAVLICFYLCVPLVV